MNPVKIVKNVFFLVSLILLPLAFFLGSNSLEFMEGAQQAEGVVIDLQASSSDGSTVYSPVVRFEPQSGAQVVFTGSVRSSPPAYSLGEPVKVYYRPENPADAMINSVMELWFGPILVGFMGTVFLVISLFIGRLARQLPTRVKAPAPRPAPATPSQPAPPSPAATKPAPQPAPPTAKPKLEDLKRRPTVERRR